MFSSQKKSIKKITRKNVLCRRNRGSGARWRWDRTPWRRAENNRRKSKGEKKIKKNYFLDFKCLIVVRLAPAQPNAVIVAVAQKVVMG